MTLCDVLVRLEKIDEHEMSYENRAALRELILDVEIALRRQRESQQAAEQEPSDAA